MLGDDDLTTARIDSGEVFVRSCTRQETRGSRAHPKEQGGWMTTRVGNESLMGIVYLEDHPS